MLSHTTQHWRQTSHSNIDLRLCCCVVFFLNLIGLESLLPIFSVWMNRLSSWLHLLASPQTHLAPAPCHEISRPTQEGIEFAVGLGSTTGKGVKQVTSYIDSKTWRKQKKMFSSASQRGRDCSPWAEIEWVNTSGWANGRWGTHVFARPVKKKKNCMSYNKVFLPLLSLYCTIEDFFAR